MNFQKFLKETQLTNENTKTKQRHETNHKFEEN